MEHELVALIHRVDGLESGSVISRNRLKDIKTSHSFECHLANVSSLTLGV